MAALGDLDLQPGDEGDAMRTIGVRRGGGPGDVGLHQVQRAIVVAEYADHGPDWSSSSSSGGVITTAGC